MGLLIVAPPPPPRRCGGGGGVGPSENLFTRGVQTFLLERGDKPEKGGWCGNGGGSGGVVANFLLLYSSITFTVCVEKVGFPLLLFGSSLFSVNHSSQDSHLSLLYENLVSFVHFWSILVVNKKCWLLYLTLFEIHRKVNGQCFLSAQASCFSVLKRF